MLPIRICDELAPTGTGPDLDRSVELKVPQCFTEGRPRDLVFGQSLVFGGEPGPDGMPSL